MGPVNVHEGGRSIKVDVPRVKWSRLLVGAPGYLAANALVPCESAPPGSVVTLSLHLRRAPTISGRVRSPDGALPSGSSATVIVHRRYAPGTYNHREAQLAGAAYTVGIGVDGTIDVNWVVQVPLDANGRYSVSLPATGRVVFSVFVPGYTPVFRTLRSVDQGNERIDAGLEAPRGPVPAITLKSKGRSLANAAMAVTDITDPNAQVLVQLAADTSGVVRTRWLVTGRKYWLLVGWKDGEERKSESRLLTWDDRRVIELRSLDTDFDVFMAK